MMKKLLLALTLATACFAAGVPRPAGEVTFEVPGKATQKLSQYRGKVVLLVAILTS